MAIEHPDATRDGYGWLPYEDAPTTIARLTAAVTRLETERDQLTATIARILGDTEAVA